MSGEILEFTKRSLCLKLAGNNKKTTKIKTSPLVKPKSKPKNLSKPEAPEHLTRLLINLIRKPPPMIQIIKIRT